MEIGDRERRSNLTIIGTQPSDAGAYGCVTVNEPGDTAEQATLIVHGKQNVYDVVYVLANTFDGIFEFIFSSHTQHHLPCGQYFHVHCE